MSTQAKVEAEKAAGFDSAKVDALIKGDGSRLHRYASRYMKHVVDRPGPCFSIVFAVLWMFVFISVGAGYSSTSEENPEDWNVPDSVDSESYDMLHFAEKGVDKAGVITRLAPSLRQSLSFIFRRTTLGAGGNMDIFEPAPLREICLAEKVVLLHAAYPDYCVLTRQAYLMPNATYAQRFARCALPSLTSPTHIFYGNFSQHAIDWSCPLLPAANVTAVRSELLARLATPQGRLMHGFMAGKDTLTKGFSSTTQVQIRFGEPLEGFSSAADRPKKQSDALRNGLMKDVEEKLFAMFGMKQAALFESGCMKGSGCSAYNNNAYGTHLRVKFHSFGFQQLEMQRTAQSDMMMAMLSMVFVFGYMWYYTGSGWIATIGMLQIVLSLPVAGLLYQGLLQIPYFVTIHFLAIFLILGIGADDIFVFVDAYKQTAVLIPRRADQWDEKEYTYHRLVYAVVRTAKAVFNTSFTTAAAFLATSVSPIMPVATFGIYAAMTIILNFIFVCTITPCTVMVWSTYWRKVTCCGCVRPAAKAALTTRNVQEAESGPAQTNADEQVPAFFRKFYVPLMTGKLAAGGSGSGDGGDGSSSGSKDRSKSLALVSVAVMSIVWIQGLVSALGLSPPSEQEQWFPSTHMFTGITEELTTDFYAAADTTYNKFKFVWGIESVQRPNFNKYKPALNRGYSVFDDKFDLANPVAVRAVFQLCETLRTEPCTIAACSAAKFLARPGSVTCFLDNFDTWAKSAAGGSLTRTELTGGLSSSSAVAGAADHKGTWWQSGGVDLTPAQFVAKLKDFRVNDKTAPPGNGWDQAVGIIGGQVKFASIAYTSTMKMMEPLALKKDYRKFYNTYVAKRKAEQPAGMASLTGVGLSPTWLWYETETGLVSGLFLGISISFPVAFIVLLFATKNVYVALLAVISIGGIVCCVLGWASSVMGWSLGTAESIAGIIIIGFSVDYVVHLGHMYMDAETEGLTSRLDRFRFASEKMGGTVAGGAITTAGSGLVMLLCELTFFTKMAVLIVVTIAFSFLFSLFFFMPTLLLIGPTKQTEVPGCNSKSVSKRSAAVSGDAVVAPSDDDGAAPDTAAVQVAVASAGNSTV